MVSLPLEAAARALTPPPARHHPRPVARRVLLVEDNSDAAASLSDALSLLGHDVRVGHDGRVGQLISEAQR
jgi:hypothetical protein